MDTFISKNPEDTCKLGERWANELRAGTVIGLCGDLGSGKTQLVRGIAIGLGVTERVTSPSFGLVNEYESGRIPLFHLDLYRLDTPEQILGAGLEPYLIEPNGIAVVEWFERWVEATRETQTTWNLRRVWIDALSESERRIRYEGFGN